MLNKILRLIFYFPIRLTTNCRPIPYEPHKHIKIDKNKPIVYLTVSSSIGNLLTIERLTKQMDLPSPFEKVKIGDSTLSRVAFLRKPSFFSSKAKKVGLNAIFQTWIDACKKYHTDIQVMPITVIWSRNPSYEGLALVGIDSPTPSIKKFLTLTFAGHDNCTIISNPFSALTLYEKISKRNPELLNRAVALHFLKKARAVVGKPFPNREHLIKELCQREGTKAAINKELSNGKFTQDELEQKAFEIFSVMAADTRYPLLKFLNTIISFFWKRFYHGQSIVGADRVRQLVQNGYEIIYIPCHRSHMDYILLSYVIFQEGLPIPQIASGDNLNFPPVGGLIRRCGSYFIRRKMKGDNFYIDLFREYLAMLFENGYATEFFIEGGRSRTGRTLPPRTGMVSMTVQTQLKGIERPIAFIPTYLGYEHVMEVGTYMKELDGAKKEKENAWQLLGIFKRFRYYGRGYVAFGEPLIVPRFLKQHVPNWRDDIDSSGRSRPKWLFDTVNKMAHEIIVRINDAAMVNGINLCAMALMSDTDHTMSMRILKRCINMYLNILKCDPKRIATTPKEDVTTLITQALELRKFHTYDVGDNMIFVRPSKGQTLQLTYFRNNILHLFALPALVANILIRNGHIQKDMVIIHTRSLFYFLRHELYVPIAEDVLDNLIKVYIQSFLDNGYIIEKEDNYYLSGDGFEEFYILACSIKLNLIRYLVAAITLMQTQDGVIDVGGFIKHCVAQAKRVPNEITRNSPEFADPILFKIMTETFLRHNYFYIENDMIYTNQNKISKLLSAAEPLLPAREVAILKTNDVTINKKN